MQAGVENDEHCNNLHSGGREETAHQHDQGRYKTFIDAIIPANFRMGKKSFVSKKFAKTIVYRSPFGAGYRPRH
jgi:hypothetical protein